MKRLIAIASMVLVAGPVLAGGRLETFKFTDGATFPGLQDVEVVGIFWDDRCTNVNYVVDNIPANPGTPDEISPQQIRKEMQASFDQWNQIPTSYINMNVVEVRTIGNVIRGFDFINELTFEAPAGAGFLASSPSTSLQQDTDFLVGDDIDGDGDSDVFDPKATRRNTCFDADKDGDIEFPAGSYKAGTILDNDVQFNPLVAWSLQPGSDNLSDIQAVAVHEFGHSHGLSHSMINQISNVDGSGSTMFPFININDLASEISQRDLHSDDVAWSSFIYQEGTARSGPGALQRGDRAFRSEYGLIKGAVTQSVFGVPGTFSGVAGASVTATSTRNGERVVEGYSGTTKVFFDPVTGGLLVIDPATSIIDGNYTMPVPGRLGAYDIAIEALDGSPAAAGNISVTAQIGEIFGQNLFPEEFRSIGKLEDNIELLPSLSIPVIAVSGLTNSGTNLVTNDEVAFRNSGPVDFIGTGAAIGVNDVIYAERFTNTNVLAQLEAGSVITSVQFQTEVIDSSVVPKFKRAGLYLGRVNADGTATVDLTRPVLAKGSFVGQDDDLTPVFMFSSALQSLSLRRQLRADATLDVFAVLEANNEFESGASGLPPLLAVSLDTVPGSSFFSTAGGPLAPFNLGWAIELHFSGIRPDAVPTAR
jgi:hypothetical protein